MSDIEHVVYPQRFWHRYIVPARLLANDLVAGMLPTDASTVPFLDDRVIIEFSHHSKSLAGLTSALEEAAALSTDVQET